MFSMFVSCNLLFLLSFYMIIMQYMVNIWI